MRSEKSAGEWVRRHRVVLVGIVVLLVIGAWLWLRSRGGDEPAETVPVVTAETATAQVRPFAVTISVLGTVDARPGAEAQLAAPAPARVERILVAVGDRVAAGQPLVALDESVWAAQTEQAQADFAAAQQAYTRASRLASEGVGPRKDVEAAAAALAQARAGLQESRRRQSLGVLRSPIAGVVTAMRATLGQAVDVTEPLVEVVNPSGLEVLFHLSPEDAARVSPGAAVRLTTGPDSAAVLVGEGEVRGISAAVDSTTGSVAVRAIVTAPARALRVGEAVTGRITVDTDPRAVVVPAAAVVPADGGAQLFVVDSAGIAHATPVTVGAREEGSVEITSGLRGGEMVVASGAYGVTDGARIQSGGAR